MTQTVPATAQLGPGKTALAIGYRVLDIDRVQYSAFTTTNVAETGTAGTYSVSGGVVCPNAGGYIVWGVSGTDYVEATVDSDVINSVSGSVSNVLAIGGVTMAEGSIPGVAAGQAGGLALYGSAGLTAQETADAVNNLAPAGASGAAGSIRSKLDAIQSVTDDIDVSAVTLATGNNAGSLTFVVGSVFDQTLTGLTTIPSDWTECIFSLKVEKDRDLDSESLVQIKVTNGGDVGDGLLYLSRSAPVSPITKADASLTVTQAAGTARIVVSSAALALLTGGRSSLDWDLKVFKTGGWSKVETSGDARIDWTPTRTT